MAKTVVNEASDSEERPSRGTPSNSAGKRTSTAAKASHDDTVSRHSSVPTELPSQFGRYRKKKKKAAQEFIGARLTEVACHLCRWHHHVAIFPTRQTIIVPV